MPPSNLKRPSCTAADFWSLPTGCHAELIDSELFDLETSAPVHQSLAGDIYQVLKAFIDQNEPNCRTFTSPFPVNLNSDDSLYVEPDVFVVCNPSLISNRACEGAPDLIVEVVSPSSRRMDYLTKADRYERAGVREYWIVDPADKRTTVYQFARLGVVPVCFPFGSLIPVDIWDGRLCIRVGENLL